MNIISSMCCHILHFHLVGNLYMQATRAKHTRVYHATECVTPGRICILYQLLYSFLRVQCSLSLLRYISHNQSWVECRDREREREKERGRETEREREREIQRERERETDREREREREREWERESARVSEREREWCYSDDIFQLNRKYVMKDSPRLEVRKCKVTKCVFNKLKLKITLSLTAMTYF